MPMLGECQRRKRVANFAKRRLDRAELPIERKKMGLGIAKRYCKGAERFVGYAGKLTRLLPNSPLRSS